MLCFVARVTRRSMPPMTSSASRRTWTISQGSMIGHPSLSRRQERRVLHGVYEQPPCHSTPVISSRVTKLRGSACRVMNPVTLLENLRLRKLSSINLSPVQEDA